jgi:hypothetical protein
LSARRRRELLLVIARAYSELAELAANDTESGQTFTSKSLPPDVSSRQHFARICRSIPGAVRRGKVWVVEQRIWEQARLPQRGVRARSRREVRDILGLERRAA